MLRLVTTLEKNSFKTLAVSFSLLIILSPLTIVIFSFETILFDNNGLTTLQNFFLLQTFFLFQLLKYSVLHFRKSVTHKFLCLVYLLLFSPVLFLTKIFISFVLSVIALAYFLFTRSILVQNLIAGYQNVINILITAVSQILWEDFL